MKNKVKYFIYKIRGNIQYQDEEKFNKYLLYLPKKLIEFI